MGYMHCSLDVRAGVGGDHTAEEGALEARGQARAIEEGPEVIALAPALAEQLLRVFLGCASVAGVLSADGGCSFPQVLDFGQTQQQGLAARF